MGWSVFSGPRPRLKIRKSLFFTFLNYEMSLRFLLEHKIIHLDSTGHITVSGFPPFLLYLFWLNLKNHSKSYKSDKMENQFFLDSI